MNREKPCPVCGRPCRQRLDRRARIYCSNACRQTAYRRRRRALRGAAADRQYFRGLH